MTLDPHGDGDLRDAHFRPGQMADLGDLRVGCPSLDLAGVEDREAGMAEVGEVHPIAVVADVEPVDAVFRGEPQQSRQRWVRHIHRCEGPPTRGAHPESVPVG
jgi:hypothetical protein